MNSFFELLKDYDIFGIEPNLYYEKRTKKVSWTGILVSILYIFIYIAFLFLGLIKFLRKNDVFFYDTFAYIEEPPSINLYKDNFYGGFALEDPQTYDTFIDERIYYPKAFFKKGKRNGNKWMWEKKEIELERCKIEKFGKAFQDKFNINYLNNLYCFKEMNETLLGHIHYDYYSMFFIQLFPCKNTTENNNHCKPLEVIDYFLKGTFFTMNFQDVELTPQNYSYPVKPRNQDIYFTVGKKLFKEIHIFYQIINVETDESIFGLESRYSKKEYLKYHSFYKMSNLIDNDIYQTGESFCNITIKLHDQIKIQKRSYKNLIEILTNIWAFMEIIYIILYFILYNLYIFYIKYKLSINYSNLI